MELVKADDDIGCRPRQRSHRQRSTFCAHLLRKGTGLSAVLTLPVENPFGLHSGPYTGEPEAHERR